MMKKRYFAIPILAIALHFLLSNLLYFLVERLVLDVFHISPQQFMKYSYWGEILIYAVLILVFFTLYKLLWRKEISEPRTATNFKDVLGSLVVGFGICGISGLWIMLAEQLPSLQKSVEAMNAGAENIAGGNAFGTFMIAVIAAPVVEEILFRGIVLRSMRKFAPLGARF
nr:CPBP family glutamic-type intramembrane protease [uncultured Agathobaculum sp.]